MLISVFYDHITQARQQTGKRLSELLAACRSWGISGLEINYTQLKKGGFRLRHAIRRAGMSVSCIYEFYDFTHCEDLARAKKHVDLAARVGAGKVLIVPGFLEEREAEELTALCCGREPGAERDGAVSAQAPEERYTEKQGPETQTSETQGSEAQRYAAVARYMESHTATCLVRDALEQLVRYGRDKGVRITLEDFDGNTSPCARMLPLKWLLEQVPGLGFTLDMGNFAYSDEDVAQGYELLKEYIVHVHCKDRGQEEKYQAAEREGRRRHCRGLACVPAGGGYLPIGELVTRLKAQGYDGYLAIEHFDAPDQMEYIRRSADYLKNI